MTNCSPHRKQQLLAERGPLTTPSSRGGRRFNEVAGGATAECAAIACCCPFGIANFLVLVVYKFPARLCRKVMRRRRLRKKGGLLPAVCKCDSMEFEIRMVSGDPVVMVKAMEMDADMMELEKQMWDQFYASGFWRSPSHTLVTLNPS